MTKSSTHDENEPNGVSNLSSTPNTGDYQRQTTIKPPVIKLKVVIRRLPPGLTHEEFTSTLGCEWEIGQGRVDWAVFKPGKASKDPSKPSRPSRAYLHLTNESYLISLFETVRKTTFEDAQNTLNSQCLIGPPIVEYAPNGNIPSSRIRVDARAGTIDQDPEFMSFLEGLANPPKEPNHEIPAEGASKKEVESKQEKVTTTPLVQYLREKKALKNKEVAIKSIKKQESPNLKGKNLKESNSIAEDTKKSKDVKAEKLSNKVTKEAVKILNRDATLKGTPTTLKPSTASSSEKTSPNPDVAKTSPNRQRGVAIAAHIRMLQRDLGITPAQAHRQARHEINIDVHEKTEKVESVGKISSSATSTPTTVASPAAVTTFTAKESNSQPMPTQVVPTAPKGKLGPANNRRGRGKGYSIDPDHGVSSPTRPSTPVVLLKKSEASRKNQTIPHINQTTPKKPTPAGPSRKPQLVTPPFEDAVQAFVKHVNSSQGITEALLRESMEKFGEVSKVEIDRNKGFAYISFIDSESLKKAIAASPISIGQGTVQVMPRKVPLLPSDKKVNQQAAHSTSRNGRSSRGGNSGRRGGRAASKGSINSSAALGLEHVKTTLSSHHETTAK